MTHPTTFAMLAADRHAELLREAEAYRRAARLRARAPQKIRGRSTTLGGIRSAWATFRRPSPRLCCA
jgi:hypothetical protein